ncbi:flagellar biosynthesis anti-sigma factor FlgM [Reinekea blandensis]|uniref:Negative regulator of flagellin synthesis n=1 Tax=Reinekea blandensis MED297 TaxID=314283 RepID=A4BEK7_9GAMM|nr:flagellar biosynthesis anti-sigma factor FlgM [Reinekea blandensis]EAR09434.1 negative regulator of flagellin synthesis FlgM [Reinekea sp. MED297] [Reinekea blandensis MED297]
MPININGPTNTQVNANKTQKNADAESLANAKSGNGTESAKQSDDVVELSDRARVLKAVESRVNQMPDIDQDKVDRIRNAISNGEYQIDYDKLAAAFRRFETGL